MTDFTPTEEQHRARVLFSAHESMVIEAGAGTGKTSTLRMLAESTRARGKYLAFNKAIVTDVARTLPMTCRASTAHSLAFQSVGKTYAHRLGAGRMKGHELARLIGVDGFIVNYGKHRKVLAGGFLAGVVMRALTRFCQTDEEGPPGRAHVPYLDGIDPPDDRGRRTYAVNNELGAFLEPSIERAWADIANRDGQLPFKHEHYLKLWQLRHPIIDAEYILFDEAQDANPVMAAVIAEQTHTQRVYVGDANQAIYEWTGAVNSIDEMKNLGLRVARLSESFRFGEVIAERANVILARLRSDLVLRGQPSIPSTRGELDPGEECDAILCRTNAGAMTIVLSAVARGQKSHLVGGGNEVLSFARAAGRLMDGEKVYHPDLACFDSWGEVKEYVQSDQQGGELRALVNLVEEFTVETILEALDSMPSERASSMTSVSTAHKSKGREWSSVRISEDFLDVEPSESELRLRYVACTRARIHLDDSVFDRKKLPATDAGADDDDE